MVLLLIGIALAVSGIAAMVAGVRGRAIDDHPICRRCGFDLVGLPDTSTRCSECGADLSRPRAIRIGHRRARPFVICVALSLWVLSAGVLIARPYVLRIDYQAHKPVWWLNRDLAGADPVAASAAFAELNKRLAGKRLSGSQVASIATRMLDVQADERKTWPTAYGDWLERAWDMRLLSQEQFTRYAQQATKLELTVRKRVRLGDPVVYEVTLLPARVGTRWKLHFSAGTNARVDGMYLVQRYGKREGMLTPQRGTPDKMLAETGPSRSHRLVPGAKTLRVELACEVSTEEQPRRERAGRFKVLLEAPFELLEPAESSVTVIRDDVKLAKMKAGLSVSATVHHGVKSTLNVNVKPTTFPCPFSYEVIGRVGLLEHRLLSIAGSAGGMHFWHAPMNVKDFEDKEMDVILEPSTKPATETVDVFEILDGELMYENVPITRQ